MGGDFAPSEIIKGARRAVDELGLQVTLVGVPERMGDPLGLEVVACTEVIEMDDKPVVALRKKKDSSIGRAAELVSNGEADALISLGNTGGLFAAATFKIGRIPGVDRGCISAVIPRQGNEFVLLDAGANIECKPLHLAQFAVMGNVYSREILKRKSPRVGILSIGTEDSKGNDLTLETFKLCQKLNLNFIGNIEGHDLFKDHVDVVVCDGFVGNIVLKTSESLAVAMFSMLKRELTQNAKRQIGAFLAKEAFRAIRRRMDPEVYGGAPLLGFNSVVLKAHGSARERAVASAIRVTSETVKNHIHQMIANDIAAANKILDVADVPAPANS